MLIDRLFEFGMLWLRNGGSQRRTASMLPALKITRVFAAHRPETVAIANITGELGLVSGSGPKELR